MGAGKHPTDRQNVVRVVNPIVVVAALLLKVSPNERVFRCTGSPGLQLHGHAALLSAKLVNCVDTTLELIPSRVVWNNGQFLGLGQRYRYYDHYSSRELFSRNHHGSWMKWCILAVDSGGFGSAEKSQNPFDRYPGLAMITMYCCAFEVSTLYWWNYQMIEYAIILHRKCPDKHHIIMFCIFSYPKDPKYWFAFNAFGIYRQTIFYNGIRNEIFTDLITAIWTFLHSLHNFGITLIITFIYIYLTQKNLKIFVVEHYS